MTEPVAQVSRTIDAPADKVWATLTTADPSNTFFMGATVESDFQVGSPITFSGVHEGKSFQDRGQVLAAEPNRRLSFSHYSPMSGEPDTPDHYHTVTIDLRPAGGATEVVLTQANLTGGVSDADRDNRAKFEKNWSGVLEGLSKAVSN